MHSLGIKVGGLKNNSSTSGRTESPATWWVNLRSVVSIHHVIIYPTAGNQPRDFQNKFASRFQGFHLYISSTTNRLDGHLCFHDTTNNNSTIPAVVNITCPVHGQFVIYYNKRPQNSYSASRFSDDDFNAFCKVEVLGCKSSKFYGSNCSLPCPSNCLHPYCHIETGACHECKLRYIGHHCRLEKEIVDEKYLWLYIALGVLITYVVAIVHLTPFPA
ncbi:uncharacterized protein LOC134268816 [Saccostrea cucullata]|uniref:uncharacterized protein LOC134268816 n=1 Tax=Saccostrea cuccullata TaxID=36930 RepID=UPI002ED4E2CA